jgi:hypothetical protein
VVTITAPAIVLVCPILTAPPIPTPPVTINAPDVVLVELAMLDTVKELVVPVNGVTTLTQALVLVL